MLSLFMKKKLPEPSGWTLNTGSEDFPVYPEIFRDYIEGMLSGILAGGTEFLILSPPKPIEHVAFIQTCPDNEDGFLHIEAGYDRKFDDGSVMLLGSDRRTKAEVLEMFVTFFETGRVDTTGWFEVR